MFMSYIRILITLSHNGGQIQFMKCECNKYYEAKITIKYGKKENRNFVLVKLVIAGGIIKNNIFKII